MRKLRPAAEPGVGSVASQSVIQDLYIMCLHSRGQTGRATMSPKVELSTGDQQATVICSSGSNTQTTKQPQVPLIHLLQSLDIFRIRADAVEPVLPLTYFPRLSMFDD